jgi:DNA-binding PadR family transcriptional regulator
MAGNDDATGETSRPRLGEFEHQVMLAVQACGSEAFGLNIAKYLLGIYGTKLAIPQVYVSLKRLEEKSFLASQLSPGSTRRGRTRRFFVVTEDGAHALEKSTAFRRALLAKTERNTSHAGAKTLDASPVATTG